MQVTFDGNAFVCRCAFDERNVPKDAGFRWDQGLKVWYTPFHGVAAKLRTFADDTAKKEIARVALVHEPWLGPLPHPKDQTPKHFQLMAAKFALARNRSYLAGDPGTGKTIMAALIMNALKARTIYVCPPFLVPNVMAEFEKWLTYPAKVSHITDPRPGSIVMVPDSLLDRSEVRAALKMFVGTHPGKPPLLFVDEAHRFKSPNVKRTQSLLGPAKGGPGIVDSFSRLVYLSGTPMPNRPMELYPVLSKSAPATIDYMNKFDYGRYYCAGYRNDFGWDFSGASNLTELASRVVLNYPHYETSGDRENRFMLRIKKTDVLPELGPKVEELLLIGEELPPTAARLDKALMKQFSPQDLMKEAVGSEHVSTYRKELGKVKVKPSAQYIKSLLDETEESLLVFAWHKDVIAGLTKELENYNPIVITGDIEKDKRFELAVKFQSQDRCRVAILNIQAGGIGFNFTKATRVIFVEPSWVPGDNDQASDRAHRIGQKDSVFVQYVVFKNSIDRAVMETVLRKRKNTQHI